MNLCLCLLTLPTECCGLSLGAVFSMPSLSLSLHTLLRFGLLTYVKLPSLLYYKRRRTMPAGNSPASSAPPQSFSLNCSFLSLPFVTISVIFSRLPVLISPAFPRPVTLNAPTSLVNPRAFPVPPLLYPSSLQSLKHRLFPRLIYSHPTPPFLRGPTPALLYNQKTVIAVFTNTTLSPSSPPPPQ